MIKLVADKSIDYNIYMLNPNLIVYPIIYTMVSFCVQLTKASIITYILNPKAQPDCVSNYLCNGFILCSVL